MDALQCSAPAMRAVTIRQFQSMAQSSRFA